MWCHWFKEDDGDYWLWRATCDPNLMYEFTEDGPVENGHHYCHACGGQIWYAEIEEEEGA